MEKKKLLLVAVLVGTFLVIIISAPLLIFAPKPGASLSRHTPPGSVREEPVFIDVIEPLEITQNESDYQETQSLFTEAPLPVIPADDPVNITITVPQPYRAGVPDAQPKQTPKSSPPPSAVKPAVAPKAAAAPPAEKPAPAVKPPAAKPPAEPLKTYNDYWIQTGAFSSIVRAEGAKELLEAKGITSIIDNSDIEGKTWYRVRVGPYTSETEAHYWLSLVQAVDGFAAGSQIRRTQSLR